MQGHRRDAQRAIAVDGTARTVTIRRYRDRDRARVWELHEAGLHQTGTHVGDGDWNDDLRSVVESYLAPGGEFVVAVEGEEIVAMGGLRPVSDEVAELKRLRVDARCQGRGIGRTILMHLERVAVSTGFSVIRLDTTVGRTPARRLFERAGYREVRRRLGPGGHRVIDYEKQIA